ncbi:putative adhesion G protein-coupled receptor E4P isoform X3 [Scyliorhinus canicula]|uniref:putative adhesion G protein-coupled receptor E4P isoform X3 n=1 Tax=Scyliorhinus canicula TaxID=7830 RepID=UPI0018F57D50|nr:putative adhesion G protein-coupled receptor E4P isoform X3 [Scyliorhinus canicula]
MKTAHLLCLLKVDCHSFEEDIDSERCKSHPKPSKGDDFFCTLADLSSAIDKQCQDYKQNDSDISDFSLKDFTAAAGRMMNQKSEWQKMRKDERHKGITLLLNSMESTVMMAATTMNATEYNVTTADMDVQIQTLEGTKGTTVLSAKENEVDFYWEKDKSKSNGFAAASLVVCSQMGSIMEDSDLEMENKKYGTEYLELHSLLLTATLVSYKIYQTTKFIIKNKEENDVDDYTICAYWDKKTSKWSTSGCTKVSSNHTHTTCRSTHLSSFAVLVALYKVEGPGLTTITYIGIITSLLCLLIAILTFIKCRAIQNPRTAIHTHLCLCLFVAELLFLIGLSATGHKAACGAIAGILHYLFLACFMWMLLEGIQLYLMVVKVFLSQSLRGKYTYPVAYGIPAIIVIISAASNPSGYGTREYCWLSMEKGFRWSFVGPLCAICLVNLIFLILTIWKLVQKFNTVNPELPYLKKIRIFIVTAFAQLFLLGCTWIFGVLHFQKRTIALAYIFTIINSFQGMFIFILHCVNNKQVREEYRRWIARFGRAIRVSKYTTFVDSSHPTSSTQAPMKQSESSL